MALDGGNGGFYGIVAALVIGWIVKAIKGGKKVDAVATQTVGSNWYDGFKTLMTSGSTTGLADDATIDPRFAAHYASAIAPQVAEFEEHRLTALGTLRKRMMIVLPALIIAGILSLILTKQNPGDTATPLQSLANLVVLVSFFALGWAAWPVMLYKGSIKQKLFPEVFRFFGPQWHYNPEGIGGDGVAVRAADFIGKNMMGSFQQLRTAAYTAKPKTAFFTTNAGSMVMAPYMAFGILPPHETALTKDHLTGDYKTVPIALLQCTLQSESGTGKDRRTTTDFHGLVITIDVPKRFSGHTTVRRDHGKLGNWFGKQFASSGLQPVKLEDPRFEARYEVYASDQVEARYLLTNTFMERIVALEDLFTEKNGRSCNIQCAFKDGKLLIILPMTRDWFQTGSVFKPANFISDINTILHEMDQLFAIVDILQLDDRTGL